ATLQHAAPRGPYGRFGGLRRNRAVSPRLLGEVESVVSVLEKRIEIARCLIECSHPEAYGDCDRFASDVYRRSLDRLPQLLRTFDRIGEPGIGQENCEFFSAEPADRIGLAKLLRADSCDRDEYCIAPGVAVTIIHRFKMIDIDRNAAELVMM